MPCTSTRSPVLTPAHSALMLGALVIAACRPLGSPPTIEERLKGVEVALGTMPVRGARYLRYSVEGDQGRWTHEVVLEGAGYAERRTREDGKRYAFGRDRHGAWLSTDERDPVAVEASWGELARTQEALLALQFARPGPDDEAEYMGRSGIRWEFAFRPGGGRTLTFTVDRPTSRPRSYDVVDDFGRLLRCESLHWDRASLASALCSSVDRWGKEAPKRARARFRLEVTRELEPRTVPAWARVPATRPAPAELATPAEFAIAEPRRVLVPVRFGDGPVREFVLDSGAFHTVVSAKAAAEMGVVPTGEPPIFATPPWLPKSQLWVGVVDRMRVGGAEIFGERVLVATNRAMLQEDAGLLGASFFRHFVVDVDSPAAKVRVASRNTFRPDARVTLVQLAGEASDMGVYGEVKGVAKGMLVLDTGMPDDMLVHAWQMKVKHPRERGSDAFLGGQPDALHSADYYSHVDGLDFGPFPLPQMDAIGRDRWREDVGGGIGIVGMGVMRYFRLSFDFKNRLLYAWPGDAYIALRRAGIDIEEGSGPMLDRVIPNGPAERAGLRRGDELVRVNGRRVRDVPSARHAVAAHPVSGLRIEVRRRGRLRTFVVDLATLESDDG